MIHLKHLTQPYLLSLHTSLDKRSNLSKELKADLYSLQKGYEGEKTFASLIKKNVHIDSLSFNDLLLVKSNSTFQVDYLLITPDTVFLYEVKNFEGEYFLDGDLLRGRNGHIFGNPKDQLNKTTALFHQFLYSHKLSFTIESHVVFINANFTLYGLPKDNPFLLHSQIQGHFNQLNRTKGKLSKKHHSLAELLLASHQDEATFQRKLPVYQYANLKKGLTCSACGSFDLKLTQRMCFCLTCHYQESIIQSVVCHAKEFQILFPHTKMTRNSIYEWCGKQVSERQVWKILSAHFTKNQTNRGTYYT